MPESLGRGGASGREAEAGGGNFNMALSITPFVAAATKVAKRHPHAYSNQRPGRRWLSDDL
jgi:hypothetical protein